MKQRVILFMAFLLFLCGGDSAWAQTTVRNEKTLKNSVADVGSVQMTSTTSSPVAYYVRSFSDDGQCVSTLTYCDNYTVIEGSHQGEWIGLGSSDDADDHYYVVRGNVEYKTLNVFGQTHLILEDGAILTCTGGIKVEQLNNQATLYIYSQSDGDSQGRITVTNSYKNAAGIGGSQTGDCGSICIHGGDITTTGGQYGAGIGGGGSDGEVCPSSKAGVVTIMGGKVMATGGDSAAGIGGGDWGIGGIVRIYGGTVTAQGGEFAPGIGGGGSYTHMFANSGGAGVDGGWIEIYGGTVTATGGEEGAGIGSGNTEHWTPTHGGVVNITGGTVTAQGGANGAGIGGGHNSDGAEVNISGGYVVAKGSGWASGIGGGAEAYGKKVFITGGTVIASTEQDAETSKATAIGTGGFADDKNDVYYSGELTVGPLLMVTAGKSEGEMEGTVGASERVKACRWHRYVRIEVCPHTPQGDDAADVASTYSIIDQEQHTRYCRYCDYTSNDNHVFVDTKCVCGYDEHNVNRRLTFLVPDTASGSGYTTMQTFVIGAFNNFYLPQCSVVPPGYKFLGWEMNPDAEGTELNDWGAYKEKDEDYMPVETPISVLTSMKDETTFYARFLYDYTDSWVWQSKKRYAVTIKHNGETVTTKSYDVLYNDTELSEEDVTQDGKTYGTCSTGTVYWEKNGYDYRFYDFRYFFNELTISDSDPNHVNSTNIGNEGAKPMKRVTLDGRKLHRDGSWNTLCLPFDITPSTDLKEACAVKIFAGSSFDSNSGTLIINFADAATIPAGTPFIIRWNPEMGNDGNPLNSDIVDPYFEYVTLADNPQACATTSTYVDFTGCFEPAILDHDYATTLYLGADGKLHYPDDEMKANSCHAYFKLKDGMAALPWTQGAVVRAYMLNLNGELRKGDVNKDGDVSISDATTLVNILCDKTIEYDEHANVDGEYGVDENDLTKLVDIILGKVLVEGTPFEEDTEHEVR